MQAFPTASAIAARSPWWKALCCALALVGCGGGVDSGGTGAPVASYASGPITGLGSVIVNGVRFDDSTASITDGDDMPQSPAVLRLGMTTEIRATGLATNTATGARAATAVSIVFASDLLGPIERVDAAAEQLVVLGQTVQINGATVFDAASASGGLLALAVGDVLEVYALFDPSSGRFTATRIERKDAVAVTVYRLSGLVSNVDTVNERFNIGSERISYSGLTLPAGFAGSLVRLRLDRVEVNGVWRAIALKAGAAAPRDSEQVQLEGFIGDFVSSSRFSVSGVAVDASGIVPVAGLAAGVRVEVEGTSRNGVLLASEVGVETDSQIEAREFELYGVVASADAASLSFVLRGFTVFYSLVAPATEFSGGTAANLAGANLEVRGLLSPDGSRLLATRIGFK